MTVAGHQSAWTPWYDLADWARSIPGLILMLSISFASIQSQFNWKVSMKENKFAAVALCSTSKIFKKSKTTLEDFLLAERKTGVAGRQILLTDASAGTGRSFQNCKHWDLLDTQNYDINGNFQLPKSEYSIYSSRLICKIQCGGCEKMYLFFEHKI